MWLKVEFDEHEFAMRPRETTNTLIEIVSGPIAPANSNHRTYRVSPIFPLDKKVTSVNLDKVTMSFLEYKNAYRVLARIQSLGSVELVKSTFYCLGLTSVILIAQDPALLRELEEISEQPQLAAESWDIVNKTIVGIKFPVSRSLNYPSEQLQFPEYSSLPLAERAIVDEFCITISLLYPKLWTQMPTEIDKIERLIKVIYSCIEELVYINNPGEPKPETLTSYTLEELRSPREANLIKHQNLDRIVQVNSALSYVSTQAFSGAIPIFERRSLIRRHSLLGIGSAMLALNNIARFIENCFAQIPFQDIIIKSFATSAHLPGMNNEVYDCADWNKYSVNIFESHHKAAEQYFKLPYFSGRLGFRETEYSIAAALQSISSGAGFEWSLLTLTHEMLHGHVRQLLGSIFLGDENEKDSVKRKKFYEKYYKKVKKQPVDEKLIDSVRYCIFKYCSLCFTHGSITSEPGERGETFSFVLPSELDLWKIFEIQYRNINEIFVHILDLHYFYASRISAYIPLIWCSWTAVPHVAGDVRQYILRSLLTIAPSMKGDPHMRFNQSVELLKELLQAHTEGKLKHPVVDKALSFLSDNDKLMGSYFPSFKGSLILVDLVYNVFISQSVHKTIYKDRFVSFKTTETDEKGFEKSFVYDLQGEFNDEIIESPLVYLLHKMIQCLENESEPQDLEKETTIQFLALNSNS